VRPFERTSLLIGASSLQLNGSAEATHRCPGLLLRAVRHEALVDRMGVRDLRRLAVVAAG
jgi:hypothetical protein